MMFLLAAEIEKVLRRFPGKPRFFLELAKRGIREMFSTFQDAARQSPLRLTTSHKKDSLASSADHGGAFFQTELPRKFQASSRRAQCVGGSACWACWA